jgi:hypothetical protein
MEITTMLSIPRIISKMVRVSRAIQFWGSAIHSIMPSHSAGCPGNHGQPNVVPQCNANDGKKKDLYTAMVQKSRQTRLGW